MIPALTAYQTPDGVPASEPARLARLFGLQDEAGRNELAFAERVAAGLPAQAAYALAPILDLIAKDALHLVVSESTLRRARKSRGALTREPSERIYELGRVIDQAARTFRGNEEAIARFLNRPNQALEGRKPFDVANSSSAGADLVVNLMRRSDAGVAV